jgi:putative transposase
VRFVFNYFLSKQRNQDNYWYIVEEMKQNGQLTSNNWKGKFLDKYVLFKELPALKKNYTFLKEVDSNALYNATENLYNSYVRHFKKQGSKPHYKSKKNHIQAYTTRQIYGNIRIHNNHIKLPKLGFVRLSLSRNVIGCIINATVKRNPSGKYFISILTKVELCDFPKTESIVGIDVGVKDIAILSDGTIYRNPHLLKTFEDRLSKAQKVMSRRKVGSSNWNKARIKVAKIHEKIANSRKDYLDKISTEIVKNHDIIGLENISTSQLLKNNLNLMSKKIADVSWRKFINMIEYKSKWYGKKVIIIERNFPSSQLCSCCGYKNIQVKNLCIREWECPNCYTQHNRDFNAAKNIKNEAIRILTVGTTGIA